MYPACLRSGSDCNILFDQYPGPKIFCTSGHCTYVHRKLLHNSTVRMESTVLSIYWSSNNQPEPPIKVPERDFPRDVEECYPLIIQAHRPVRPFWKWEPLLVCHSTDTVPNQFATIKRHVRLNSPTTSRAIRHIRANPIHPWHLPTRKLFT